jgi:serine protease
MKKYSIFLLLSIFSTFLNAQDATRKQGEIIVQLQKNASIQAFLRNVNQGNAFDFSLKNSIAPDWQMHVLRFDETNNDADEARIFLNKREEIMAIQFNHQAQDRILEPNDSEWWRQWDMEMIGGPIVWESTTGGLTLQNDTIVVAVLEKGADMEHADLKPNRWYNYAEIPNNNIDDDANGFVDDFNGWNPRTLSDDPGVLASHGTGVNGIIGAVGNNQLGVTGVNWKIKLMNLGNVEFEDEIIAAYYYVNKQRSIYNKSNGAKGAFVVSTNASFGLDFQMAAAHSLWCAVYDSLGKQGIVSVGATANKNTDVDTKGDMPTSCTSEFLITVTNIDNTESKVLAAGYGVNSIDLGAPGTGTYTTTLNDGYAVLGGTSASCPHVTGAIGWMYSINCPNLSSDAKTNPIACAKRIRDLVLSNVAENPTLVGVTKTGGRLDLAKILNNVIETCGGSSGDLAIESIRESRFGSGKVEIFYQTPDFTPYNMRVFNALGQLMVEKKIVPEQFSEKIEEVDTFTWPRGVYMVALGRGQTLVGKPFFKG